MRGTDRLRGTWRGAVPALSLLVLLAVLAASALAFSPEQEGRNYAKTLERERYITKTPEFQARLAQQEVQDNVDLATIAAAEAPAGTDARNFTGNVCFQRKRECAGDVRFYDWAERVRRARARALHRAQRRNDLGQRLGSAEGPSGVPRS